MAQSLSQILLHCVFSTKNRERNLTDDLRQPLHDYVGGILRNHKGFLLSAGSVEDHIHLFIAQPRTISVSDLVKEIKVSTSIWIKNQSPHTKNFQWQSGYGVFSISPSHENALRQYIQNQKEHHQTITFQDEYRQLLGKYGITYDEKYVWD